MFSSIASFIFGSNTSATTNPDSVQPQQEQQQEQEHEQQHDNDNHVCIQPEHTVEVTSLTPSVTGTSSTYRGGKRGKGNKRQHQQQQQQLANKNNKRQAAAKKATPSITKLLTPSGQCFDAEDRIDEDDWFIVEKEQEEDEEQEDHDEERSLPRTDSEDDVPVVVELAKPKPNETYAVVVATTSHGRHNNGTRRRAAPHITSHSLYNGPRVQPQQQRKGGRGGAVSLALRSAPARANSPTDNVGGVTQSLYVANHEGDSFGAHGNNAMDESWFVTPPPCFTSIGPIHMETSPFENLLIEHPSMSVYHSIRSAQEATDSFVNLDLGVEESQQATNAATTNNNTEPMATGDEEATMNGGAVVQRRSAGARIDRYSAAQLKQELLARNTQKNRVERERQSLCRGAIKRANKVRDVQSRGNRQRRSDMQHCKIVSGANNNRKCCF